MDATIKLVIAAQHDGSFKGMRDAAKAVFHASLGVSGHSDDKYTRIDGSQVVAEIPLTPADVCKLITIVETTPSGRGDGMVVPINAN